VLKWEDKRDVPAMSSCMTSNLFQRILDGDTVKPKCICNCNLAMGGTDFKNYKLKILNVTIHNSQTMYIIQGQNVDHQVWRNDLANCIINTYRPPVSAGKE
jgi:hypothetical protein